MKPLGKEGTAIFSALIAAMQGGDYLKITNDPFMPLTIEKIGEGIATPSGQATLYSLCHYYEQNGDLMQDPEMCFMVTEASKPAAGQSALSIYPYMFRQASLGIDEESARIRGGRLESFNRSQQAGHAAFADQWLRNIRLQGFLKMTDGQQERQ